MRSFIKSSAVKMTHRRQAPALISFVVWSYNHEPFLEKAIQGAFAQTYEPLEVILSDDHSQDRSFAIMEKMAAAYRGPHTLVLNRNPHNLGIAAHINRIVALARGSIIFLAGGDDFSLPSRVEDCYKIYCENPDVYGVWANAAIIDDQEKAIGFIGNYKDIYYSFQQHLSGIKCRVVGCSTSFRKEVFDRFGPLDPGLRVEDIPIHIRVLLFGKHFHLSKILVRYRLHANNLSRIRQKEINSWNKYVQKALWLSNEHHQAHTKQHIRDAQIALDLGIISHQSFADFKIKAISFKNQRILFNGFLTSKNRLTFYLLKIAWKRHFSIKEKLECLLLIFGLPGAKLLIFIKQVFKRKKANYSS